MVVKLFKIFKTNERITNMFERLREQEKREKGRNPDIEGLDIVQGGNKKTKDALPPLPKENDEAAKWLREHEKSGGQMS